MSACCSTITRPGLEASLDSYHPSFGDIVTEGGLPQAVSYCAQINRDPLNPMGFESAREICNVNSGMTRYDCAWYGGRCPSNRSGVGTDGRSPPRIFCCKTRN